MLKQCSVCKKIGGMVWRRIKLRGKYNPTIKRKQRPNLQWMKSASGRRVLACAKCIKAMTKKK